jgi:hypothetical protein
MLLRAVNAAAVNMIRNFPFPEQTEYLHILAGLVTVDLKVLAS